LPLTLIERIAIQSLTGRPGGGDGTDDDATADPFEALHDQYRRQRVTGEGSIDYDDPTIRSFVDDLDATVESRLEALVDDPDDRIWPEAPLGEGHPESEEPWRDLQQSYDWFRPLARAFVTPTSAYEGDRELLEAIEHGYAFLADYYRPGGDAYGNWWQWEIGIPDCIVDTLVLVGDDLPDDLVEHHAAAIEYHVGEPDIRQGSGDLLSKSDIWARLGIAERSGDAIRTGRDPIADTLEYSPANNFYPDGSAIDHGNIPYSLHYQGRFLRDFTRVAQLLDDSPWSLRDPEFTGDLELLYEWAYEAYEPLVWRGQAMSMVLGRHLRPDTERDHGSNVVASFIRLGAFAPEPHATRFRRIAKAWIERDTYGSFVDDRPSIPAYAAASALMDDDSIAPWEPLKRYKQYYNMDRAVYRDASYALGLAMLSERIGNYEVLSDGRGPSRGWFTSYGMTYLYTDDLAQYNDAYWQTVDPRRLPGTTANPAATGAVSEDTYGNAAHAGGVEFDGRYGTSSMVLSSVVDPALLRAHKSWFCFGESVVAVGSGIEGEATAGDGAIATTVANRNLGAADEGRLLVDGDRTVRAAPATVDCERVGWAHLDRPSESIGYVFPTEPSMRVVREENCSDDPDIGARDVSRWSDDTYTRYFATLVLDHGTDPDSAEYTYAVVPGVDAATTADYRADPPVEVLERSPAVHAVEHADRSLMGVQAFEETTVAGTGIAVDGPASVMYREAGDELTVAVADPTQQRDAIEVELPVAITARGDVDPALSVRGTDPLGLVASTGDLAERMRGETLTATFDL
jgi:hyaluronate lyase